MEHVVDAPDAKMAVCEEKNQQKNSCIFSLEQHCITQSTSDFGTAALQLNDKWKDNDLTSTDGERKLSSEFLQTFFLIALFLSLLLPEGCYNK